VFAVFRRPPYLHVICPLFYAINLPLLLIPQVLAVLSSAMFVTITSDGWSRSMGDGHIINFCAHVLGASYYIDAVAPGEQSCTGAFIASEASHSSLQME
jgi:hypothetical protein